MIFREGDPGATRMIIDAGHLSVVSKLADKAAVQSIRSKRNQMYSEGDFKELESLMYDKFTVGLKDAKVTRLTLCSFDLQLTSL